MAQTGGDTGETVVNKGGLADDKDKACTESCVGSATLPQHGLGEIASGERALKLDCRAEQCPSLDQAHVCKRQRSDAVLSPVAIPGWTGGDGFG